MKDFLFSRTLLEAAVGRPALVGFGDVSPVLAWTARDGNRVTVAHGSDGGNFVGNAVLPDGALDGPALAYGEDHIYLAWTGTDGVIRLRASGDGLPGVSNTPQIFGDDPLGSRERNAPAHRLADKKSPFGPALAWGGGVLYLAWADAAGQLNLAMTATALGDRRPRWSAVRLGETTAAAPALSFIDNTVYLAWRRQGDRRLMVLPLSPRLHPARSLELAGASDFAPALVKAGGRFHLFWTEPQRLRLRSGVDLGSLDDAEEFDLPAAAPAA